MNGIELIAAERNRQIEVEGWTAEHDDEHGGGELAMAAASYCVAEDMRKEYRDIDSGPPASMWPWDEEWWKPTPDDRIRELVKAGALIVAEIDRLQRTEATIGECDEQMESL